MQLSSRVVYLYFVLIIIGTVAVHGDPEPVAKPTQPAVITSPEELRRYLELVKNYYSASGKFRYGKRGNVPSSTSGDRYTWNPIKTMLSNSEQSQQRHFEKRREEKNRDYEGFDAIEYAPRFSSRPFHMLDIVGKYYTDDV